MADKVIDFAKLDDDWYRNALNDDIKFIDKTVEDLEKDIEALDFAVGSALDAKDEKLKKYSMLHSVYREATKSLLRDAKKHLKMFAKDYDISLEEKR